MTDCSRFGCMPLNIWSWCWFYHCIYEN